MNTNSENLSQALEDLTLLVSRLKSAASKIEIDLALAKTREIYDCLLHWETPSANVVKEVFSEPVIVETQKVVQEEKVVENVVVKVTEEPKVEKEPEAVVESAPEPIMELDEEPEKEEETVVVQQVTEVTTTKQETIKEVSTHTVEKDILAEKFKRSEPLINEFLARAGKRDLSSILQAKPVKNIEAAIGINERFEFVRVLFNGDNATYLKTIRILDSAANFNEAFNYINQTFSWDYENETVHKLLDLVRRRYITD